jgi:hypothetical protein
MQQGKELNKSSNNPSRLMKLDFDKILKLTFSKQNVLENQTLDTNLWLHSTHHFLELAEYTCTQSIILNLLLDFELYNTEETEANQQEDDEVYYEDPDLSGGIEGIDYIIEYGVNSEDRNEEAYT